MRPLWGGWQKPGAADSRPLGFRAFAKCPEKREGGYQKSATPNRPTPRSSARAENNPPLKVFSKWPESKGAAEAHERTQGAAVLGLEGP